MELWTSQATASGGAIPRRAPNRWSAAASWSGRNARPSDRRCRHPSSPPCTPSATFSTIAGRPISSGNSSALIAVPITSRDLSAGPVLPLRAKTVACGVMTPSQPPDQTIGICAISASERCRCFMQHARNAWSARMRVKSLTPPLPSVLPITAMTCRRGTGRPDASLEPGGILHGLQFDLGDFNRHSAAILSVLACSCRSHPRPVFAAQHLFIALAAVNHRRRACALGLQLGAQRLPSPPRRSRTVRRRRALSTTP